MRATYTWHATAYRHALVCRSAEQSQDAPASLEHTATDSHSPSAPNVDTPQADEASASAQAPQGKGATCKVCGEKFANAEEQRRHFKLDWHRLNVKRSLAGLPPLPEQQCEQLLQDDASSVSGSGVRLLWLVSVNGVVSAMLCVCAHRGRHQAVHRKQADWHCCQQHMQRKRLHQLLQHHPKKFQSTKQFNCRRLAVLLQTRQMMRQNPLKMAPRCALAASPAQFSGAPKPTHQQPTTPSGTLCCFKMAPRRRGRRRQSWQRRWRPPRGSTPGGALS